MIDEGRAAATAILAERNRLTKDAVTSMDRNGRADDTADRMHRGRELGGGVCLGVAHAQAIADGAGLSVKERMEVVMDLQSVPLPLLVGIGEELTRGATAACIRTRASTR